MPSAKAAALAFPTEASQSVEQIPTFIVDSCGSLLCGIPDEFEPLLRAHGQSLQEVKVALLPWFSSLTSLYPIETAGVQHSGEVRGNAHELCLDMLHAFLMELWALRNNEGQVRAAAKSWLDRLNEETRQELSVRVGRERTKLLGMRQTQFVAAGEGQRAGKWDTLREFSAILLESKPEMTHKQLAAAFRQRYSKWAQKHPGEPTEEQVRKALRSKKRD